MLYQRAAVNHDSSMVQTKTCPGIKELYHRSPRSKAVLDSFPSDPRTVSPINRVHLGCSQRSDGLSLSQTGFTIDFSSGACQTVTLAIVLLNTVLFLFIVTPIVGVCNVICFVVRYFMSIQELQSSWWGRESWLLCLICPPDVSWWLSGFSSRCHGVVCGLWLWCFLIILTYYFLLLVMYFPSKSISY